MELGTSDVDDEGCGIELGDEEEVETPVRGARGWSPGYDVGEWVGRGVPLEPQAQVLALNVVVALRRLPSHALQLLCCRRRKEAGYISAAASVPCVSSMRLARFLMVVTARPWHPEGYYESGAGPVGRKVGEAVAGEEVGTIYDDVGESRRD